MSVFLSLAVFPLAFAVKDITFKDWALGKCHAQAGGFAGILHVNVKESTGFLQKGPCLMYSSPLLFTHAEHYNHDCSGRPPVES